MDVHAHVQGRFFFLHGRGSSKSAPRDSTKRASDAGEVPGDVFVECEASIFQQWQNIRELRKEAAGAGLVCINHKETFTILPALLEAYTLMCCRSQAAATDSLLCCCPDLVPRNRPCG